MIDSRLPAQHLNEFGDDLKFTLVHVGQHDRLKVRTGLSVMRSWRHESTFAAFSLS